MSILERDIMKRFSQELKESAVALYEQGDVTYSQLAHELGISVSTLEKWVRQSKEVNYELSTSETEELKRLQKENKRLRIEREILKKQPPSLRKSQRQEGNFQIH